MNIMHFSNFSNAPKYTGTVMAIEEETKHSSHKFTAACYPTLCPCTIPFGKHKTLLPCPILTSAVVEIKSQRDLFENI